MVREILTFFIPTLNVSVKSFSSAIRVFTTFENFDDATPRSNLGKVPATYLNVRMTFSFRAFVQSLAVNKEGEASWQGRQVKTNGKMSRNLQQNDEKSMLKINICIIVRQETFYRSVEIRGTTSMTGNWSSFGCFSSYRRQVSELLSARERQSQWKMAILIHDENSR